MRAEAESFVDELRRLPLLLRRLVWVHEAFEVLTISGLGVVSLVSAAVLATGSRLSRSECAFIAVFWGTRLAVQWLYFTPNEYLTRAALKVGYHLLAIAFVCLTLLYGWGAIRTMPAYPW